MAGKPRDLAGRLWRKADHRTPANISHLFARVFTALNRWRRTTTTRGRRPIRLPLIEGKDIRFTHLSTEQGLSQSRVDHMLQDRRGFIWIGTNNGLNRYDGYRFKTYKPDPNNPNSLGDPLVTRYSKTDPGSYGSASTRG